MNNCIVMSIHNPKIDPPGKTNTLAYAEDFFPGATREMRNANALQSFSPCWNMQTFCVPALSDVSEQEIDDFLCGIKEQM